MKLIKLDAVKGIVKKYRDADTNDSNKLLSAIAREVNMIHVEENLQIMDCTGCIHAGNKQFCLNCKRGGVKDYYLTEENEEDKMPNVHCIDGSCPMALSEEYEERGMDVVHSCEECGYNEESIS